MYKSIDYCGRCILLTFAYPESLCVRASVHMSDEVFARVNERFLLVAAIGIMAAGRTHGRTAGNTEAREEAGGDHHPVRR